VLDDCETVGERSLEFGLLTLKKRMEDFSTNYLDRTPVIEASTQEMYEFDLAVHYAGEIL
jgi:hypothetical protein